MGPPHTTYASKYRPLRVTLLPLKSSSSAMFCYHLDWLSGAALVDWRYYRRRRQRRRLTDLEIALQLPFLERTVLNIEIYGSTAGSHLFEVRSRSVKPLRNSGSHAVQLAQIELVPAAFLVTIKMTTGVEKKRFAVLTGGHPPQGVATTLFTEGVEPLTKTTSSLPPGYAAP